MAKRYSRSISCLSILDGTEFRKIARVGENKVATISFSMGDDGRIDYTTWDAEGRLTTVYIGLDKLVVEYDPKLECIMDEPDEPEGESDAG